MIINLNAFVAKYLEVPSGIMKLYDFEVVAELIKRMTLSLVLKMLVDRFWMSYHE